MNFDVTNGKLFLTAQGEQALQFGALGFHNLHPVQLLSSFIDDKR